MLATVINFITGVLLVVGIVLITGVPIAFLVWKLLNEKGKLQERKYIKKFLGKFFLPEIPQEIIKEVKEENERREEERKEWGRKYEEDGRGEQVTPKPINPNGDKKATGRQRRVQVPAPDKSSKDGKGIELTKPSNPRFK